MKWLKWIGIVLVVLVVLFVGVSFLLPSDYRVERSVTIDAGPEQVHQLVGHLERWPEWTPWQEMDPTIETVLGDQTTGIGAHQKWDGDSGSGELTFTRCDASTGIAYDLAFDEGKHMSVGTMDYETTAEGTKVTWTMAGDNEGIIGRWFGVMMDAMVGPAFENGLAKLKTTAEALPPTAPSEMPADAETATETG